MTTELNLRLNTWNDVRNALQQEFVEGESEEASATLLLGLAIMQSAEMIASAITAIELRVSPPVLYEND